MHIGTASCSNKSELKQPVREYVVVNRDWTRGKAIKAKEEEKGKLLPERDNFPFTFSRSL